MVQQPITIDKFRLEGFRAYLKPKEINLRSRKNFRSLVIFAPNARGKSSLVDSFEYYFSRDGTLARLGKQARNSYAGPSALQHVDAEEQSVTAGVHFWFRQGNDKFDALRSLAGSRPKAAERVLSNANVPFRDTWL